MGVGAGQHQTSNTVNNISGSRQNRQTTTTVTNLRTRMSLICENCSVRFSLLKRKKRCNDCGRVFCAGCLAEKQHGEHRRCKQCQSVIEGEFSRYDLSLMKVSHLRSFLNAKNIPTALCTEKADLIDLVLEHYGSVGYHRSQFEHGREINRMAEKMKRTNDQEGPPRSTYPVSTSNHSDGYIIDDTIIIPDSEDEDNMSTDINHVTADNQPSPNNDSVIILNESNVTDLNNTEDSVRIVNVEETINISAENSQETMGSRNSSNDRNVHILNNDQMTSLDDNNLAVPEDIIDLEMSSDVINISADDEGGRLRERQEIEMAATERRLDAERSHETENNETRKPKERKVLDDITSIDELNNLTVRELKELLVVNFVDYKGCCERWELEDRVRRLWTQKQQDNNLVDEARKREDMAQKMQAGNEHEFEPDICKICMDAAIDCVLLECGHMMTCTKCGKQLAECPICRQYISRVVHTFRA